MADSRRWIRIALACLLALIWVFLVALGGAFVTIPSESLGWLWMALLYAVGLVAAAFVWGVARQPVAMAVVVVLASALGVGQWWTSPPTHERVVATADTVDVPEDWEPIDEQRLGSTWCFKGCPVLERDYTAPVPYATALAQLADSLEADGWDRRRADPDRPDETSFEKSRWELLVSDRTGVRDDSSLTRVELSYSG